MISYGLSFNAEIRLTNLDNRLVSVKIMIDLNFKIFAIFGYFPFLNVQLEFKSSLVLIFLARL